MRAISADGLVPASSASVFAFLSDLRNHWQLTDKWVRMIDLTGPQSGPTGAWVELRGPLGVRRRLRTTVIESDPPRTITGVAEVMPRTRARVSWVLEPVGDGLTRVHLQATLVSCGGVDRLLLAIGARHWLARRFGATLAQLAGHLVPADRDPPYLPGELVSAERS